MGYGSKYGEIYGLDTEESTPLSGTTFEVNLEDILALSDSLNIGLYSIDIVNLEDTLVLSDSLNIQLISIATIGLQDNLVLTDQIAPISISNRLLQDNLTITDNSISESTYQRIFQDNLTITDNINTAIDKSIGFQDSATILDNFISKVEYERRFGEEVNLIITDQLISNLTIDRSFQDVFNISDSLNVSLIVDRQLSDNIVITDVLSNLLIETPEEELFKIKSVWNQFDEFGLLVGIKRIRGEYNWSLKRRILDVFANHANSSYRGLVNSITRELGLALFEPLAITPKTSSGALLANDPYIHIDGTFLYLYSDYANNELERRINIYQQGGNYEHITRMVDFINTSSYFEASIISGYEYTRTAVFLNQSNRVLVKAEVLPVTTKFQLKHPYIVKGSIIVDDNSALRQEVATENEVTSTGKYWVDYNKGIIRAFSFPLTGTNIRYEYIAYPFYPIASPIILHDINHQSFKTQMFEQILSENGSYLNGTLTELGSDIIEELYSVVPMYWGK